MSAPRRSKRKAAEAALDALAGIHPCQASQSVVIGTKTEIFLDFHGVILPEDVMMKILGCLPKKDLIHRVSLVNSSWHIASQNPILWPFLKAEYWKDLEDPSMQTSSIQYFLDVIRRPQFSRLMCLEPPKFVQRPKNATVWDRIATSCPQLRALDLGLAPGLQPKCDKELLRLSVIFPRMLAISINAGRGNGITENGVAKFAQLLGEKIWALDILAHERHLLSDNMLDILSQSCPNLLVLRYHQDPRIGPIQITPTGILNFLNSCSKLEKLALNLPRDGTTCQVFQTVDRFLRPRGREHSGYKLFQRETITGASYGYTWAKGIFVIEEPAGSGRFTLA